MKNINSLIKILIFSFFLILSTTVYSAENTSYQGKDFYINANVGIATHDTGISGVSGATLDDDDTGYIISVGRRMSKNWGFEGMYYDMGSATLTGSTGDTFVLDGTTYQFDTGATISNSISGFGGAAVGYLSTDEWLSVYGRLGLHIWNQEGSVTALNNDVKFSDKFFDSGEDMYWGIGVDAKVLDNLAINVGYEWFNYTDDVDLSVDYYTTLLFAGLKYEF